MGPFAGRDLRAELAGVPEPVRTLLIETSDAIAKDLCEFSSTCCPHFGAKPRTDCMQLADETVSSGRVLSVAQAGMPLDPDPTIAARCAALVRAGKNDCVFPEHPEWLEVCRELVRNGDGTAGTCTGDYDCELMHGESFLCGEDRRCMPAAPVVAPELGLGESCTVTEDCAAELYCAAGSCATRKALGVPCVRTEECGAGLKCPFVSLGESPSCVADRQYGEACTMHTECGAPGGRECIEGVCRLIIFDALYCAPVTVDDIAGSTQLRELDDSELDALCSWAQGVFVAEVDCMGRRIATSGCKPPSDPACTATVAQYRTCWPRITARIDGCRLTEPEYLNELRELVRSTPGCGAAIAPCVEMLR